MFRVNYPFLETVLWSAKRVKKVKLFGRTCLLKFAKSLREFLSSLVSLQCSWNSQNLILRKFLQLP